MTDSLNDRHPIRIHIPHTWLQRSGYLLLTLAVLFSVIGGLSSPVDEQGNPVLLLPDVKALEDYRRSAAVWLSELSQLDGEISRIMTTNPQGDIFTLSSQAQQTLQHAVQLTQTTDQTTVPPIAWGVHELVVTTCMTYLESARATLQWVSAPVEEHYDSAMEKLTEARTAKTELETYPWMTSH